jgi:hypothetical protein
MPSSNILSGARACAVAVPFMASPTQVWGLCAQPPSCVAASHDAVGLLPAAALRPRPALGGGSWSGRGPCDTHWQCGSRVWWTFAVALSTMVLCLAAMVTLRSPLTHNSEDFSTGTRVTRLAVQASVVLGLLNAAMFVWLSGFGASKV